jgi:uncharacterized protein (TIGR03382 family)
MKKTTSVVATTMGFFALASVSANAELLVGLTVAPAAEPGTGMLLLGGLFLLVLSFRRRK